MPKQRPRCLEGQPGRPKGAVQLFSPWRGKTSRLDEKMAEKERSLAGLQDGRSLEDWARDFHSRLRMAAGDGLQ
ncbi:hypothetical protein NDU88_010099 [Pleurodeles waltl]|uniref:Uncharacterized protein n=1 Tax=Pleurodeles waltl TaxID=8319 RepID=A0AAV7PTY0_PLEWA|nr:hypothetical protein NDU88_010099 [Pleurodeles waltl]